MEPTTVENDLVSRISRLENAIFGFGGTDESGVIHKLGQVERKLDRLLWAVIACTLTIAASAASVVLTTLSQGGA